jgi:acyl-CoA thioester hydrolase
MRAPAFSPQPYEKDPRFVRDAVSGLLWHRVAQRVLFADTDRTGAVYHANYFRFFEMGRSCLLRDADFARTAVEDLGYQYPIFQAGVDFFRPVGADAQIVVHSRPAALAAVRVTFDYLITLAETGAVLCRGFTRHCATNRNGRPVAVDPVTAAIFRSFPT